MLNIRILACTTFELSEFVLQFMGKTFEGLQRPSLSSDNGQCKTYMSYETNNDWSRG